MKQLLVLVSLLSLAFPMLVLADDRPPVTVPRATSGDTAVEPDWAERLTITVGPEEGRPRRQHRQGHPGRRRLRRPPRRRHGQDPARHLQAAQLGLPAVEGPPARQRRPTSILIKEPSVTTKLAADSDWYDQEITLDDADRLRGRRRRLPAHARTRTTARGHRSSARSSPAPAIASSSTGRCARTSGRWATPTATTLFPLLTGENIADIAIENLTLDGNRANNDNLDGNYAGCIFLQDCSRITIRGVTARNYNGDGISWQICHDVLVENCTSRRQRRPRPAPRLRLAAAHHPQQQAQAATTSASSSAGASSTAWPRRTSIEGNRVGISIGHRDTDNLVTRNDIAHSKDVGVLFRPERGKDFAGHRNRIEEQADRQRPRQGRRHRHPGRDRGDSPGKQRDHRDARLRPARRGPPRRANEQYQTSRQRDSGFRQRSGTTALGLKTMHAQCSRRL